MSSLPVTVDLTAYRGDSWEQAFRFLENGVPIDPYSSTMAAQARDEDGNVIDLRLEIQEGEPGELMIVIGLPEGFVADSYEYDVEVTDANGLVTTWVRGLLTVTGDVTNAPV